MKKREGYEREVDHLLKLLSDGSDDIGYSFLFRLNLEVSEGNKTDFLSYCQSLLHCNDIAEAVDYTYRFESVCAREELKYSVVKTEIVPTEYEYYPFMQWSLSDWLSVDGNCAILSEEWVFKMTNSEDPEVERIYGHSSGQEPDKTGAFNIFLPHPVVHGLNEDQQGYFLQAINKLHGERFTVTDSGYSREYSTTDHAGLCTESVEVSNFNANKAIDKLLNNILSTEYASGILSCSFDVDGEETGHAGGFVKKGARIY